MDVPPNVFAPNGRLYNVEDAVHTVSNSNNNDNDDTSSTSLIVLQCNNGSSVVVITTLPQSPYMIQPLNDDDDENDNVAASHYGQRNDHNSTNNISSTNNDPTSLCLRDCTTGSRQTTTTSFLELEYTTTIPPFGRIQWPQQQVPLQRRHIVQTKTNATNTTIGNSRDAILSTTSIYRSNNQRQAIPIVLSMTVGNAVESQILRHRIYQTMEQQLHPKYGLPSSSSSSSAVVLARTLADQNQQRTQIMSTNSGRILAATAVLIDYSSRNSSRNDNTGSSTIYQIDPSGQYWICQAVVLGRYAAAIEQRLHDVLLERYYSVPVGVPYATNQPSPISRRQQVCTVLSQLSVDDAITIATQCMVDGATKKRRRRSYSGGGDTNVQAAQRSHLLLRGIAISTTTSNDDNNIPSLSIQTFSHHGLLSRLL